ncbi:MAG: AAA family ATPase [Oscillospiraceae bacterium]|nr:AAA family ATPase [Oscillospiraceae bacterium]
MADNYVSRYGLTFNPFIKNSKDIIVATSEYDEVRNRLDYLKNVRGFGLLTGNPGQGKTTVVRKWAEALNPSLFKVVYSCLSSVTVMDFYRSLALALGSEPAHRKTDNFRIIQEAINSFSDGKRITPIIIIDEVNHLNNAILSDLKMLFNFDMDSKDKAVILLVGLPQICNALNLSCNEALRQRLVMNYEMSELSKEDARSYISMKLEGAESHQNVFDDAAVEAIVNSAGGIPRVINKLCNAALLIGNAQGQNLITADTVMRAVNDCSLR